MDECKPATAGEVIAALERGEKLVERLLTEMGVIAADGDSSMIASPEEVSTVLRALASAIAIVFSGQPADRDGENILGISAETAQILTILRKFGMEQAKEGEST